MDGLPQQMIDFVLESGGELRALVQLSCNERLYSSSHRQLYNNAFRGVMQRGAV